LLRAFCAGSRATLMGEIVEPMIKSGSGIFDLPILVVFPVMTVTRFTW
jgi:hypothetical protein